MELAEMDSAALFGLITMVTWRIWIVVGNAASKSMDPRTTTTISYLVMTLLAFGFIVVSDTSPVITARGGLLTGVAGLYTGVGLISMCIGFAHGSTTVISTLEAMYFVVMAVIGVVALGENLTITELTDIAFAILGIVLVTR